MRDEVKAKAFFLYFIPHPLSLLPYFTITFTSFEPQGVEKFTV